jgi:hypothetical protein
MNGIRTVYTVAAGVALMCVAHRDDRLDGGGRDPVGALEKRDYRHLPDFVL